MGSGGTGDEVAAGEGEGDEEEEEEEADDDLDERVAAAGAALFVTPDVWSRRLLLEIIRTINRDGGPVGSKKKWVGKKPRG